MQTGKLPSLESFLDDGAAAGGSWADATAQDGSWAAASTATTSSAPEPAEPVFQAPERGPQAMDDDYISERPPFRTYVGNLPYSCVEQDVRDLFAGLQIQSIRMINENATGRFKGFAYVDFVDVQSMREALRRDEQLMQNRPVRVDHAERAKAGKGGDRRGGDRTDRRGGDRGGKAGRTSFWSQPQERGSGGRGSKWTSNESRPGQRTSSPPEKVNDGRQRRPLSLLPRTKPIEPRSDSTTNAPFGDARPREAVLAERRTSEDVTQEQAKPKADKGKEKEQNKPRAGSDRGAHRGGRHAGGRRGGKQSHAIDASGEPVKVMHSNRFDSLLAHDDE